MKLSPRLLTPTDILLVTVTLALMGCALLLIALYGRNIPLAEDWTMVPALTGNEPHFWQWLWSQNNEHRVPLPRSLYLMLLTITGGDFRVGMVFNVFLLGALALAMFWTIRCLRGGRSKVVDLFFPVILLHIGNDTNLFWSWQLSFVVPVALVCGILLVLLVDPALSHPAKASFAGGAAIALPLCGAIGLAFMPFLTLWLGFSGLRHLKKQRLALGMGLILAISTAVTISLLYFVGYERPNWNPPSPGLWATLKTSAQFVALGWGPIAGKAWPIFIFLAFGLIVPTGALLFKSVYEKRDSNLQRSIFLLLYFGNLALFSLAMGHGRAGLVPVVGLPSRYVLLAEIMFLTAFFLWDLYGKGRSRTFAQSYLFLIILLILPLNTYLGFSRWIHWYSQGMGKVEQDLVSNIPLEIIAETHGDFLAHWFEPERLASYMEMLRLSNNTEFRLHTRDFQETNQFAGTNGVRLKKTGIAK